MKSLVSFIQNQLLNRQTCGESIKPKDEKRLCKQYEKREKSNNDIAEPNIVDGVKAKKSRIEPNLWELLIPTIDDIVLKSIIPTLFPIHISIIQKL